MTKNPSSYISMLVFSIFLCYPTKAINTKYSHERYLKELDNSNDILYQKYLHTYNLYLSAHPEDVEVLIERCKFIQNAQYDEYNEINPNQTYFDSCFQKLVDDYPMNPEVLMFQMENTWGDSLRNIYEIAESSIQNNKAAWSDLNLGKLYYSKAVSLYYDKRNVEALDYMVKACMHDDQYQTSIEYASILLDLNKHDEAYGVLADIDYENEELWTVIRKAELLLQIKEYDEALDAYSYVQQKDSTYNNNQELAKTMMGIGKLGKAREYLVADTSVYWDKSEAYLNLFIHDLNYHSKDTCLTTYNAYRTLAFANDPLSLYRLKIFFKYPSLSWEWRDIAGILLMLLILTLLVALPLIWLLPVYVIGHRWKIFSLDKGFGSGWGLKHFWWISVVYLLASFFSLAVLPESIKAYFDTATEYTPDNEQLALSMLVFMFLFAIGGLITLFKSGLKVFVIDKWFVGPAIGITLGAFFVFKVFVGIYLQIGVRFFDINLNEIAMIPQVFCVSRTEISAFLCTYGGGIVFLIICLLVPLYEEIIFRGVVLDSCSKYINFRWANILQASFFALIHNSLFMFPVFFTFGMILGVIRKKSGGLWPGILFHTVNNSVAFLAIWHKM